MLINHSKKNALIQLINCKEKWTVKNISDLFDGKLFCDIIKEVFPETYELLKKEGQIIISYEELSKNKSTYSDFESEIQKIICKDVECKTTVIQDSGAVQKPDIALVKSTFHDSESILPSVCANESVPMEVDSAAGDKETTTKSTKSVVSDGVSVSEPVEFDINNSKSFTEFLNPSEKDKKLTSNRYRLIQYFIDVRYNLKSETVITFSECWEKNELELAKVLIFILSEVVRHYVRSNDPLIQTLSLVDAPVQKDLEQCFNFFINERSKITKGEVEKILTSSAPYKISNSPNNGYCSTPRSCSSKYRRLSPKSVTESNENVYTNSPLKTYFESPVFTKADLISKEKEILKMKQILYDEESNSCSLEQKIQNLEKKIEEKNKEINDLKIRNRMLLEKEKSEDCENCMKCESIIEQNKRRIKELEENIKENNEETYKKFEDVFIDYQIEVAESMSGFYYHLRNAEKEIREVTVQLEKTRKDKEQFEIIIKKQSEELDEKNKELEVYKEKLSYADGIKEEPESPVLGECMGKYFKEEDKKFLFDASAVCSEEKSVKHVMVQFPEQTINAEQQVESDVLKIELPVSDNIPDCVSLKKCSENAEIKCSDVCSVSPKLDTQSEQSVCSASKEAPFVDNSYPSVTKDGIGSLWHQYDNSISENENENNNYLSVTNFGFGTVWQNNNFIPEIENTDAVSCEDDGPTKALSILQKIEYDLNQMSKHASAISKVSSGPNGSNGLYGSPLIKQFLEELKKYVQKSALCLSEESQIKFQNNNSISKKMIDEVGGSSNEVVSSKCFECSKVGNEISNITIISTINQENSALVEKTQELDSMKDKYKMALKSWTLKEKELEKYKRKYSFLKTEYLQSLKNIKETELKCQKIENDLKEALKREIDFKRESKKEKNILKMQIKEMSENFQKLQAGVLSFKIKVNDAKEENKKLHEEISSLVHQNEKLSSHIKYLEKQVKQANAVVNESSSVPSKSVEGKKDKNVILENTSCDTSRLEYLLVDVNKVDLQGTGSGNSVKSALQKSIQGGLHFHNYDEEEFLNHSSLKEIQSDRKSSSFEDLNRMYELCKRNTMVPSQLKCCYALENLPVTPVEKNLPKFITDKKLKAINPAQLSESNVHTGKKRKVSEIETKSNQFSTPVMKAKRKFLQTPTSLKRWCQYRRNQRSGSIKPKP